MDILGADAVTSLPLSQPHHQWLERFGSSQAFHASARELDRMLRERGIMFGEGLLPTYPFAYIAPVERIAGWAEEAELAVAGVEYLARWTLSDRALYDAVGLNPEAFDLVSIDPGYSRSCVICRPDGIPAGNGLKLVELNCDSPAMMMFLDIVSECLLQLDVFASVRDQIVVTSASDRLLDVLLDCYREYGGTGAPTIAIADWEGQKTRFEHLRLAEHFEARGCSTVICDPRAFRRIDGKLHVGGRRIDLVYRRALASEIIERRDELEPLLSAYSDGSVCMVNPLRSYVVSAKAMLSKLATLPAELHAASRTVPRTLILDNDDVRATVLASPQRWALKKSESHGGMNVVLPGDDVAWRNALDSSSREVWVAQEYLQVPQMDVPVIDGETLNWSERYFNWNPFIFGGRYAGGLVRVSNTPLINITLGGGLMPTFTM